MMNGMNDKGMYPDVKARFLAGSRLLQLNIHHPKLNILLSFIIHRSSFILSTFGGNKK